VTIDGSPVSYVAIMAAIIVVMAFIPASVVIGGAAGGWPLHDVIHPFAGLLLGPIAGPIGSVIGIAVGMAIAPYTSLGPWTPLMGAMSAFAVGMVVQRWRAAWLVPWVIVLVLHVIYFFQATVYGIGPLLWFSNTFTVTVALVLIAIPAVRNWAVETVRGPNINWKMGAALYVLFFFGSTAGIQALWVPSFAINPWPAEAWLPLAFVIFLERTVFTLIGALIALGVIAGLRRSSFVKPARAGF